MTDYKDIHITDNDTNEDAINKICSVIGEDNLITFYIKTQSGRTMAYPEYHLSCILTGLSMAVDRKIRINISVNARCYPNLWSLLLGQSSITKKTTSIVFLEDIISPLVEFNNMILPNETTPEKLIKLLESKGQRTFIKEEYSGFLSKVFQPGSYQSGFDDLLCQLFDNPDKYDRQLQSANISAKNIYINILSATTPSRVKNVMRISRLGSGYIARHNIVYPNREVEYKEISGIKQQTINNTMLVSEWLLDIYQKIHGSLIPAVNLTDEAWKVWNEWVKIKILEYSKMENSEINDLKSQCFGRRQIDVLKMALLIEISKKEFTSDSYGENKKSIWEMKPLQISISKETIEKAIWLMEEIYIKGGERFIDFCYKAIGDRNVDIVRNIICKYTKDNPITRSEVLRRSGLKKFEFDNCVDTLKDRKEIEEFDKQLDPKDVRTKTTYYYGDKN